MKTVAMLFSSWVNHDEPVRGSLKITTGTGLLLPPPLLGVPCDTRAINTERGHDHMRHTPAMAQTPRHIAQCQCLFWSTEGMEFSSVDCRRGR